MKILAYDTSSDVLSVALFEGCKMIEDFHATLFTRHSSVLVPTIEKLMRKCRWKAEAIGCIAVGLGPGSFTGLRVGITTAKVLSFVTGAKLVGVPSLEIIACQAETSSENIAVMLDARKGKVYAALYKKNKEGLPRVIQKPVLTEAADFLKKIRGPVVFLKEKCYPKASDLGKIAFEHFRQKKFIDPFQCEPLYLHPKDCNVIMKKRA